MANTIELAKGYTDMLDEVFKAESRTAILEGDALMSREGANVNEILIPKMNMDGLADYSRATGYVQGDVSMEWETRQYNYDRGRLFVVDSMDDEETAGIAFGKLAAEFIRTKVVPEDDAFTFATLAGADGAGSEEGTLSDGEDVVEAISNAVIAFDEAEVPQDQRILFITKANKLAIDNLDTTKSRAVLDYFQDIVEVEPTRFYTAIDLLDGSGNDTIGGYAKASDGADINFMAVYKPSVIKYWKHVASDIITPEANQTSDGYMQKYRKYGIVDVYENKAAGIYVNYAGSNSTGGGNNPG